MKSVKLAKSLIGLIRDNNLNRNRCHNYIGLMSESSVSCVTQNSEQSQSQTERVKGNESSLLKPESESSSLSSVDAQKTVNETKVEKKREKLRKWVLLLSYCGQNYFGMQRQTQ